MVVNFSISLSLLKYYFGVLKAFCFKRTLEIWHVFQYINIMESSYSLQDLHLLYCLLITVSTAFNIHPRNTLHFIKNEFERRGLRKVCEEFVGEDHLALSLDTWSLEIDLNSKPDTVGACVAVFSARRGLHVIAIATSVTQTKIEWNFVVDLAIQFKKVVNLLNSVLLEFITICRISIALFFIICFG